MMRFERAWTRLITALLALCAANLCAAPAQAAFITYLFDAPIFTVGGTFVTPPPPPPGVPPGPPPPLPLQLPPELSNPFDLIGQRISGFVTVSDLANDVNPDPARGTYGGFGVIPLFSATLAGNTFALDRAKPGTSSVLAVNNQDTPPSPGLPASNFIQLLSNLGTGFFPSSPAAEYAVSLSLILFTQDLSIITSDALPTDLTVYPNYLLSLSITDRSTQASAQYQANTRLTRFVPPAAAPEPGTTVMLGLGLIALMFAVRMQGRS
jgi:hypothetical protein